MQARMNSPAMIIPGALEAMYALAALVKKGPVPARTLGLVHLRASQINGCSFCVDMGARELKEAGETDERLWSVATWREAPYFTDAERAALALAEAGTEIAGRANPVPDEIWNEAAKHYDEQELATIVLCIGLTNLWNRLNVITRQVADSVRVWSAAAR